MRARNLTGFRGDHFTVSFLLLKRFSGRRRWMCECDCGTFFPVFVFNIVSGNTTSCGCMKCHKHGMSKTPTYVSWKMMIQRCFNSNATKFYNYGGRGITVSERWLVFQNFLDDMGIRPDDMTLDRFPNMNGNYEPGNVRWATIEEQNNNTRQCVSNGKKSDIIPEFDLCFPGMEV